jgi:hypothetical protein
VTNDERDELKASLLHRLRPDVPLGPEDGDEAFARHILLAIRIHHAAKLNQTVSGEGKGWTEFVTDYFPAGRNSAADADLLWTDWRVGLVKDETPLGGIALSHGQPGLHWQKDMRGALVIDLESMYDDFEHAVNQFIAALQANPTHAAVVLQCWRDRTWSVQPFELIPQMPIQAGSRFTGLIPGTSVSGSNSP